MDGDSYQRVINDLANRYEAAAHLAEERLLDLRFIRDLLRHPDREMPLPEFGWPELFAALEGIDDKAADAGHDPTAVAELSGLRAEVAAHDRPANYEKLWLALHRAGGPYYFGKWASEINHADPCDCDEDNENAGDNCMANSVWTYAVFVDSGEWPRLIVRLPQDPPPSCEDDVHVAALSTYRCCPCPGSDES